MSKKNYCFNGNPVTDQVVIYQKTHKSDDFLPILLYYENFKDIWFSQLSDYLDRMSFESEFEFKLMRAVDSFSYVEAKKYAEENGLSLLGNFNRWFYKILTNWKSNVKTSAYRVKKRPSVLCPVCGRSVGKIDEEHLQHYKTTADMPRFFVWEDNIYEFSNIPKVYASIWGKFTPEKMKELKEGNIKQFCFDKRKVRWPWRLETGKRGVLCPFTKKIIDKIDNEYIKLLPDKYNRYAQPMKWEEFISTHPSALIQTEVYSIDYYLLGKKSSENINLSESVVSNNRVASGSEGIEINSIANCVDDRYEHTFSTIDKHVEDLIDRKILKMFAAGYNEDDMEKYLGIDRKDIKKRVKNIKETSFALQEVLMAND